MNPFSTSNMATPFGLPDGHGEGGCLVVMRFLALKAMVDHGYRPTVITDYEILCERDK